MHLYGWCYCWAGTLIGVDGKFPEFTRAICRISRIGLSRCFKGRAFIAKVRIEGLRALAPLESVLMLSELFKDWRLLETEYQETLVKIALDWAKCWQDRNEVGMEWTIQVCQPVLIYFVWPKIPSKGQSGIVTFGVKEGFESAKRLLTKPKFISLLPIFRGY